MRKPLYSKKVVLINTFHYLIIKRTYLFPENLTEQKSTEEEVVEVLPADITKNMIAFYEHLQNKK